MGDLQGVQHLAQLDGSNAVILVGKSAALSLQTIALP
jgi:hypothetical protein